MDDLLSEFLTETMENMETLDNEIVILERNPNDEEILANIFRLVHTIKGTCGFLGLPRLEAVAHASENVFGKFRDKTLVVKPEAVSVILESLDRIRDILDILADTGQEPEGDDSELIERLNHLAETGDVLGGSSAGESASSEASGQESSSSEGEETVAEAGEDGQIPRTVDEFGFPQVSLEALEAHEKKKEEEPEETGGQGEAVPSGVATQDVVQDAPQNASHSVAQAEASAPAPAAPSVPAKVSKSGTPAVKEEVEKHAVGVTQSIRVNVDLLENLMTMVSELVLTRNQLLQILRGRDDAEFGGPLQRLSYVTTELQDGVMKTRMQPIGNAWGKLPRIIRDLSIELGKKIELQMIGAETELDRQVLDIIKDPLTHMVRNSADHGIESPEERLAAGKSETGTVTLNAYHEGGHIHIEISDDGRGLNLARIREKAVSQGITTWAELETMTEHQICQFVFHPGFSTAQQVTSVSGRGVGMDVVKTNIDKIGGNVDLHTTQGKGSTFTIKIPLTLAIVSALIVECGGEKFAVPQINVTELVRSDSDTEHTIEDIQGTPVLRLRDNLLPLLSMHEMMGILEGPFDKDHFQSHFIVVAHVGTQQFGIIVDRIFDSEEIVVKPVSSALRSVEMFSGNTILGDGSVIMILDLNSIAKRISNIAGKSAIESSQRAQEIAHMEEKTALLLFRADGDVPKAVPLTLVSRLEEVDFEQVERVNGQYVIQYRGSLMPLVSVNDGVSFPDSGKKPTLVFSEDQHSMGLVTDEILDIVEDTLKIENNVGRPGIMGSAIVGGKATEIIDVSHYLSRGFPDWFKKSGALVEGNTHHIGKKSLLLVDDSSFFRNLMLPILSVAGYEVTVVNGAIEALQLRDSGRMFDIILSDIEMPDMNGFDFCETVRSSASPWSNTPVVAMSSYSTMDDIERGHAVGFTDYVAKKDHDALLDVLNEALRVK